MSCLAPHQDGKTVAVIGGGFSGSLFALKLVAEKPAWTVLLIEQGDRLGRGLAYGACGPQHILNVPVSRMEVGLKPSFADWLHQRPAALADALAESDGTLGDAFVPRALFGSYLEQQVSLALGPGAKGGIRRIHGEAMKISLAPRRVQLDDGRTLDVDAVILATGHEPTGFPLPVKPSANIVAEPWALGALGAIDVQKSLLLVGSGLTMVDTLLSLQAQGHKGSIHVVSRHGLLPWAHQPGGSWGPVLTAHLSPREALRTVREHVRQARKQAVPWQRVFDAVRPAVAGLWHNWSIGQRAQFLRHLRARWDVHRHRMAGRIACLVESLVADGQVDVIAGRVLALDEGKDGVAALIRPRNGKAQLLDVGAVINCTGPRMDIRDTAQPLLAVLQRQGLALSDPLGLGLESEDCALRGADGSLSDWLYALGPLTRPAWWEIVAVPEINAQVERLVRKITSAADDFSSPLLSHFLDIGAGI